MLSIYKIAVASDKCSGGASSEKSERSGGGGVEIFSSLLLNSHSQRLPFLSSRFVRYYLWQYSAVSFEPLSQTKYSPGNKLFIEALFADIELGDQKTDDSKCSPCQGHEDDTYFEFPAETSSEKDTVVTYQNWNPGSCCDVESAIKVGLILGFEHYYTSVLNIIKRAL